MVWKVLGSRLAGQGSRLLAWVRRAPARVRQVRPRAAVAGVVTVLACLLVLFALVGPNQASSLTPVALLRVPVEALVGVVLVLLLPARARRVGAVVVGVILGLLLVLKLVDMGFYAALARPFDPVVDWSLFEAGMGFLRGSIGQTATTGVAIGAVVLAVAVLVLMPLAVLRLSRLVAQHPAGAKQALVVLGSFWVTCALLGVQLVPGMPVASRSAADLAYQRTVQVYGGVQDRQAFAAELAADPYQAVPGERLLTALRGKDVVVAFVESYGRDAVENPRYAPTVGAVLDDGQRRLHAAGFGSRSAYLTSPTVGGASWLAHATLLSGVWVDNQQRYRTLVGGDRMTLNRAFGRAGWRTVGVFPGVTQDWPEGAYYGYDQIYTAWDLEYEGPRFTWAPMPDQYTLAAFQRLERARTDRTPVMAELALVSSHAPWTPMPRLVGWDEVDDDALLEDMIEDSDPAEEVWRDPERMRTEFGRAVGYTVGSLISYVEHYGDDDLVLVFLGDHQPAPVVTGEGADHDVPITIVASDPAVLAQISGWGWQGGLAPDRQAPVWRMDAFRDRFLSAFGP